MARISGINIPLNKRAEIGLTYIYGIGRPTANKLLDEAGISADTYVRDLTEDEVVRLRDLIDADALEPREQVTAGLCFGGDPGADPANGAPRDPHQRGDRGLRAVNR